MISHFLNALAFEIYKSKGRNCEACQSISVEAWRCNMVAICIGGAMRTPRPNPLQVNFEGISQEFQFLNHWILWRYERKEG